MRPTALRAFPCCRPSSSISRPACGVRIGEAEHLNRSSNDNTKYVCNNTNVDDSTHTHINDKKKQNTNRNTIKKESNVPNNGDSSESKS